MIRFMNSLIQNTLVPEHCFFTSNVS